MQVSSSIYIHYPAMPLQNPVLVGFGIKDRKSFLMACEHAAGAIIGSAYIKVLHGNIQYSSVTNQFIHSIIHPA